MLKKLFEFNYTCYLSINWNFLTYVQQFQPISFPSLPCWFFILYPLFHSIFLDFDKLNFSFNFNFYWVGYSYSYSSPSTWQQKKTITTLVVETLFLHSYSSANPATQQPYKYEFLLLQQKPERLWSLYWYYELQHKFNTKLFIRNHSSS